MSDKQRKLSPREAREQAAEATGFLASKSIWVGDEEFEIPQRGLLDDEQRDRLNELELETESWDREPDVTIGEDKVRGPLKIPYRKGGKLIKPAYPVQVAIALWGKEKYEKFKAGGGRGSDVTAVLAELDKRLEERERSDPKSAGSSGDVEGGADTDRV
jgi:hypothetical protein